jgi:hypothetical protein
VTTHQKVYTKPPAKFIQFYCLPIVRKLGILEFEIVMC